MRLPGFLPEAEILFGDAGEVGVEFDADDFAEGHLGGEEDGSAHACSDVDEGAVFEGGVGLGFEPVDDELLEDGGGDSVVGGVVAVVGVVGGKVAAGDESAGLGLVLGVEGMAEEAFFFAESGESGLSWGHWLGLGST